ncbi:MmgE/PrpD family protein [Mycobacterium sp. ITM-2016-00317]|uniref:MmgE/PrpD family protein n=1 Tax=Mycobacterium sp. ITM-2016-00317 TaxID=2099694 RepID=UPI00287F8014|nr:MmgE/PrpD family protein [Mycobacterium sp. ITM-2016-00317]WNG86338.1 MmgE/PrpD family protein [Mycobacterium sp. ITM-2016-00317]
MLKSVPQRTSRFSHDLAHAASRPLPDGADRAARRSLFNVLGTTIGAAMSPAVEVMLETARGLEITGSVPVLGRRETVDQHWGALLAGTAGHYDDFDDTHLATVIHPGAATLGAVVALHDAPVDGEVFLRAFALGCEAQLRIGNAISPNHYDRGWHITGTCGVFGATVAAAVILGYNADQLDAALAAASAMTLGHREAFGSMTKPFHAGKAASNGILAARRGADGTSPFEALGDDGILRMLADEVDEADLFGSWDRDWELEKNAFKPYPCGIVAHPAIDAAVEASGKVDPDTIVGIDVSCHALVPELMGILQPKDGLQARFSARHGVATGLLDGAVGLTQFSDARATSDDAARLRAVTKLIPAEHCARDEATVTVHSSDRDPVVAHVPHARGSLARPLTDDELLAKVSALTEPVLGADSGATLHRAVEKIGTSTEFAELLTAGLPAQEREQI